MVNYEVEADLLHQYIPYGTELDYFNERCFVSLVGFMFLKTKIKGFPIPFHRDFEEVNLRFYVKKIVSDEVRRGVVFIKEIVPRTLIMLAANYLYNENYESLQMKHQWKIDNGEISVSYHWKKNTWNSISAAANPEAREMRIGSEEEFIAEHYWGYSGGKDEATIEYEVVHPRWEIYDVRDFTVEVDFESVYGEAFSFLKSTKPASVFLAEGSSVSVMNGKRQMHVIGNTRNRHR